MSRMLEIADQLKVTLESIPALAGVPVIVDRQDDIEITVARKVAEAKGAVLVILYVGSRNVGQHKKKITREARYSIELTCRSVLKSGNIPADTVIEAVTNAIHGWLPDDRPHCQNAMHYDGDEIVPACKGQLKYDIQAKILAV